MAWPPSVSVSSCVRSVGVLLGLYADRRGHQGGDATDHPADDAVHRDDRLRPRGDRRRRTIADRDRANAQGFATGGEYASATAFLVESAPPHHGAVSTVPGNCSAGAWRCSPVRDGLVTHCLDAESWKWGWRVPFLFGLLIESGGIVDPPLHGRDRGLPRSHPGARRRQGLLGVLREYRRSVLVSMGLTVIGTVSFYVVLVNMPTFAHKQLGLPDEVFMVQMAAVALMTLVIPLAQDSPTGSGGARCCWSRPWPSCSPGLSAVRLGRRGAEPGAPAADATVAGCTAIGSFFGPAPTAMTEQFPVQVRSTGLAVAWHLAVMLFGGFAAFIVTWLTRGRRLASGAGVLRARRGLPQAARHPLSAGLITPREPALGKPARSL